MSEHEETLISFGGSVKRMEDTEDGKLRVGGVLVRFGAPDDTDADREYFTKETYFGMKPGERKHTPVWFNHRMPFKSKGGNIWVRQPIGEGWMELTDEGVLIDAIIDAREVYENVLSKLGWSSGTAASEIGRAHV